MQTIIAGSIRPQHRLVHTGRIDSAHCPHPQCNKCNCDTTHLFWKCPRYDSARKPYLACIERMIKHLGRKSETRHKRITQLLETPCFQQCGICPADVDLLKKSANITISDPHVGVAAADMQFHGGVGEQTIVAGDIIYSKIYSDGSCREGNIRSVARAGWGVFVAPDSPHNFHAPLDGPVQTSYRAELNAVLHILRHSRPDNDFV